MAENLENEVDWAEVVREEILADRAYAESLKVQESYQEARAEKLQRRAKLAEKRLGLKVGDEPAVSPERQPASRYPDALGEPISEFRERLHPEDHVAKAVYRKVARRSPNLTDGEFRLLEELLAMADSDFTNCFPGRRILAKRLGGDRKRPLEAVKRFLRGLEQKGWIERIPFHREENGRFSTTGYRFLIPPDEISPEHPGWVGPVEFGRRNFVVPRKLTDKSDDLTR